MEMLAEEGGALGPTQPARETLGRGRASPGCPPPPTRPGAIRPWFQGIRVSVLVLACSWYPRSPRHRVELSTVLSQDPSSLRAAPSPESCMVLNQAQPLKLSRVLNQAPGSPETGPSSSPGAVHGANLGPQTPWRKPLVSLDRCPCCPHPLDPPSCLLSVPASQLPMVWSWRGESKPGRDLAARPGRTNRPSIPEMSLVVRAPLLLPVPARHLLRPVFRPLFTKWLACEQTLSPSLPCVGPTMLSWPLVPLQNSHDPHCDPQTPHHPSAMCGPWLPGSAPSLGPRLSHLGLPGQLRAQPCSLQSCLGSWSLWP